MVLPRALPVSNAWHTPKSVIRPRAAELHVEWKLSRFLVSWNHLGIHFLLSLTVFPCPWSPLYRAIISQSSSGPSSEPSSGSKGVEDRTHMKRIGSSAMKPCSFLIKLVNILWWYKLFAVFSYLGCLGCEGSPFLGPNRAVWSLFDTWISSEEALLCENKQFYDKYHWIVA